MAQRWSVMLRIATAVIMLLSWCGRVKAGWIDPDTKDVYMTKKYAVNDRDFELVFSDEFNRDRRTFEDGHDTRWTAMNKNDYTNDALQFYSHDLVTTKNGSLEITTLNKDITFKYFDTPKRRFQTMKKNYISGMVQTWNKFCFTGGVLEVSAKLPGKADVGGLWPAIWLMGNLARATYVDSSDFVWPWSYNQCDRSTPEKRGLQRTQAFSPCDKSVHYNFHPMQGRGAPEIDVLEVMAGDSPGEMPYVSTSYQVAPGTATNRPVMGNVPDPGTWYEHVEYGENSTFNRFFFGTRLLHQPAELSYWTDAISGNHLLHETHFGSFHTYRVDWEPGEEGYIRWYVDDEFVYGINSQTLDKNGAQISMEPMYILLNTAVSNTWGFGHCPAELGCKCDCFDAKDKSCACAVPKGMKELFPVKFEIDSIRVYQAVNSSHNIGCSTKDYPTHNFIKANAEIYKDPENKVVMKDVVDGGGSCSSDEDCNGNLCKRRKCVCDEEWTGPLCKVPPGGPVVTFEDHSRERWMDVFSPMVPNSLGISMALIFGVFLLTLVVRLSHRKKRTLYSRVDSLGLTIPFPVRIE